MPYVILALPRSRTYWLSRLLGCEHDPSRFFPHRDHAVGYLNDGHDCIDTALGLAWSSIAPALRRDLRVAVIHRAVPDVAASLERIGMPPPLEMLHLLADRLLCIPAMHFPYAELATYEGCARLAHHCSGAILDPFRWEDVAAEPVECDFAAYRRDAMANAHGIAAMYG